MIPRFKAGQLIRHISWKDQDYYTGDPEGCILVLKVYEGTHPYYDLLSPNGTTEAIGYEYIDAVYNPVEE